MEENRDNRNLVDNNKAQTLNSDEIKELKENGINYS